MSDLPALDAYTCRRNEAAARAWGNEERAQKWARLAEQKEAEMALLTGTSTIPSPEDRK